MQYHLVFGNRVYSSWSLRVWILLRHFEIPFTYEVIPLYTPEFEVFRAEYFPSKAVPTLKVTDNGNTHTIWDSLAITEFLHEQHPKLDIWPSDPMQRAIARSLCAEIHSGFNSLRSKMPMNLRRIYKNFTPDEQTQFDTDRIEKLWAWVRSNLGVNGAYLFGERFTAVDAFFVPVAERFRTYSIELNDESKTYMNLLLNHPAVINFNKIAQDEPWIMEHNEFKDHRS